MKKVCSANTIITELLSDRGISINKIKSLFAALDGCSFDELFAEVKERGDDALTAQFIYYLYIFRDEENIKSLFKESRFSYHLLESFFHFVKPYFLQQSLTVEQMDRFTQNFKQEDFVDLFFRSAVLQQDCPLKYYCASMLDRKHLEDLFNSCPNLPLFVKEAANLSSHFRDYIFEKNSDLLGYISMFFQTFNNGEILPDLQRNRSINSTTSLEEEIMHLGECYDMECERTKDLHQRDLNRIKSVIRLCVNSTIPTDTILKRLIDYGILLDQTERSLIEEIIHNPLYRQLLQKYAISQSEEAAQAV